MTETFEVNQSSHTSEALIHGAGMVALAAETDPQLDRAAEVAAAIDPEHTLPDVELVPVPTRLQQVARGNLTDVNYVITHQGQEIGKTTMVTDKSAGERWFNGIEISGAPHGEGFGMAAYKTAIVDSMSTGLSFRTHGMTQSEGARRVWDSLASKGVARVVEPFVNAEDDKYAGLYVIDAVKI